MLVLVTGAAGFIGSHLAERLVAHGHRVIGLDNFDPFYARRVKERNLSALRDNPAFVLVEGDVTSTGDLDRAFAADEAPVEAVVHLAALAGVRPSLYAVERFFEVNLMGTVRLVEACRRSRVERLLLVSSSSVYGADSEVPFREDAPCSRPLSPYAASKRAAELVAANAHHLWGLAVVCARLFTVHGPRQRPDLAIHRFVSAIAAGEPIELFGDGTSARDYTFVDDIVDGLEAGLARLAGVGGPGQAAPSFDVYNLGGARTTTLLQLVESISRALGRSPRIVWKPEQAGDMKKTLADLQRAQSELGYHPGVSVDEGIDRFVAWWRENDAGP
jgi:UDP-glucuronate 4-epimerase